MLGMNHWELDPLLDALKAEAERWEDNELETEVADHPEGGKVVMVSKNGRTFKVGLGVDGEYVALDLKSFIRLTEDIPNLLAQNLRDDLTLIEE